MKREQPNLYEGMYIISATLSDDARNKILDRIKAGIAQFGGEIKKIHEQGRKRLAYDIQRQREGYYYLIYFSVNPSAISKLWHDYHLTEGLLRFITLRTEEVMEKIEFKSLVEQ